MNTPINLFSRTPGRVHVMGICGTGAAGVAWILHLHGWEVSGCDLYVSPALEAFFRRHRIEVFHGHAPEHLEGCDALVYSAAVRPGEPELAEARDKGLVVLSRGECLAGWVSLLNSAAVCGTHGKTTTSCFLTRLLQCAGEQPLWCLGGNTAKLRTSAGPRAGSPVAGLSPETLNRTLAVAEADESDGTLALECPAVTVVTNIAPDHLDHFSDIEDIERCFGAVIANTRRGLAVCADAPRALRAATHFRAGEVLTYGFSPEAVLRASDLRRTPEGVTFTLHYGKDSLGEVALGVPGDHNVLNALAALAGAILLGLDARLLARLLPEACDELPKRRFQWMTPSNAAVRIVMDYAHHPDEILATLSMARPLGPKRLRIVFQPHRYSRTKELKDAFVAAFKDVDELILQPVFAASEPPCLGGKSHDLYAALRTAYPSASVLLARDARETEDYLRRTAQEGDIILVLGAGDVNAIAERLAAGPALPCAQNGELAALRKALPERIVWKPGAALGELTFYRVGGEAELLAEPQDIPALSALLLFCHAKEIPVRIAGQGTNTWFSDFGVPGVLCRLSAPAFKTLDILPDGTVTVGAGFAGAELLAELERRGLAGLEFMTGIPGTVGGWVHMNAGAHGHAIWGRVKALRALTADGQVRHIPIHAVTAGYRQVKGLYGLTLLDVVFRLEPDTTEAIRARRKDFLSRRAPLAGLRCCGSFFRNPTGLSAGAILDRLGAKGWTVGGAYVAPQHANVLAAGDGCTASDLLALALRMRDAFEQVEGVELTPEVCGVAD